MSRGARIAVLALGVLLAGMGLLMLPNGAGLGPLLVGIAVLLSLVFEGRYRKGEAGAAPREAGWEQTGEMFRDEETGQWVHVWFNRRTGERRYVAVD